MAYIVKTKDNIFDYYKKTKNIWEWKNILNELEINSIKNITDSELIRLNHFFINFFNGLKELVENDTGNYEDEEHEAMAKVVKHLFEKM